MWWLRFFYVQKFVKNITSSSPLQKERAEHVSLLLHAEGGYYQTKVFEMYTISRSSSSLTIN